MRYLPSDKYNIAWFKLAECVSRGEKERALGVYRLLAHSIEDRAFVHQLEGDILLAFGDRSAALQAYQEAFLLYKKGGRLLQAIATLNHLMIIGSTLWLYAEQLAAVYRELGRLSQACEYQCMVVDFALQEGQSDRAMQALQDLEAWSGDEEIIYPYRIKLIFALLANKSHEREIISLYAKKVLDVLVRLDKKKELQYFCAQLQAVDPEMYQSATATTK